MKKIKFLPFYFIAILPFPILYLLSDFLCLVVYRILGYRKKVVRENLTQSFPEKTEKELRKIESKFYHHFCDVWIEAMKLLGMNEKQVRQRVKFKNPELLNRLYEENRSFICYTGHIGNWEWLTCSPDLMKHDCATLYQELSSGYFDGLMLLVRSHRGMNCVESKSGYKNIVKISKGNKPYFIGMVGDQSPGKQSAMHWTPFLNRETAFIEGTTKIAQKLNITLLYPMITKVKRGYYEYDFILLEKNPKNESSAVLTEKFANALEKNIRTSPHLWLWSHRRWKLKKEMFEKAS